MQEEDSIQTLPSLDSTAALTGVVFPPSQIIENMLLQGDELMQVALNCILTKFTISAQALPTHTAAQSSEVQNCDQESAPQAGFAGPPVGESHAIPAFSSRAHAATYSHNHP